MLPPPSKYRKVNIDGPLKTYVSNPMVYQLPVAQARSIVETPVVNQDEFCTSQLQQLTDLVLSFHRSAKRERGGGAMQVMTPGWNRQLEPEAERSLKVQKAMQDFRSHSKIPGEETWGSVGDYPVCKKQFIFLCFVYPGVLLVPVLCLSEFHGCWSERRWISTRLHWVHQTVTTASLSDSYSLLFWLDFPFLDIKYLIAFWELKTLSPTGGAQPAGTSGDHSEVDEGGQRESSQFDRLAIKLDLTTSCAIDLKKQEQLEVGVIYLKYFNSDRYFSLIVFNWLMTVTY